MPSKKCQKCGLFNHETALRCDCGYDFTSEQMKESYLKNRKQSEQNNKVPYNKVPLSLIVMGFALALMVSQSVQSRIIARLCGSIGGTLIAYIGWYFLSNLKSSRKKRDGNN